jgi:hypothetical protein
MSRSFPTDSKAKVDNDFISVIKHTVDFSNSKKTSSTKQTITDFFIQAADSFDRNVLII